MGFAQHRQPRLFAWWREGGVMGCERWRIELERAQTTYLVLTRKSGVLLRHRVLHSPIIR